MSSQSSHGNLIVVHESENIVGVGFPGHDFVLVRVAEVSWVKDIHIPLLDDLTYALITLLSGLLKKLSQFSAWSKASGMKIRLGLSLAVDWMRRPLNTTSSLFLKSGPE